MSPKVHFTKLHLAVGVFIYVLCGAVLVYDTISNTVLPVPSDSTYAEVIKPKKIEHKSSPVTLKIPSLGVDTSIDYVGLTEDGTMDASKGPTNVAWYALGTRPGEVGSAVIAGHFGWKDNLPAVFDNLHKVSVGDKVFVIDDNKNSTTFVVRELRRYANNQSAEDVFNSGDGKVHLNLITCEGSWNKNSSSYSHRLVVFTDKE